MEINHEKWLEEEMERVKKVFAERLSEMEAENYKLRGDLLDAKEEYVQRQEWAAEQSMVVIKGLQAENAKLREMLPISEEELTALEKGDAMTRIEELEAENKRLRERDTEFQHRMRLVDAENERLRVVVDAVKTLHTWGTKEVDTQKCVLITMQSWERLEEAFAALEDKA